MYHKKFVLFSGVMAVVQYTLLVMSMYHNLEPEGSARPRCRKTGIH